MMHQRKKIQAKQNFKTIKKTTLQQINYTQQLHIPTYATMDLRQGGRSIQLKKTSNKKPISRKSRCISVKQSSCQVPLNLKQLLKQFKSMKLIQSRSRSPQSSSKSKRKNRKSAKLITKIPNYQRNGSEMNLTTKIERTLQKLRKQNFFRDEDESEIPLISTSEAYTESQKNKMLIQGIENFEDINIQELRLFCKQSEPGLRMSLDYFKGNIFELMARRIQRAWRRYQTKKLVQRYASLLIGSFQESSKSHSGAQRQENLDFQSSQLCPDERMERKETYISNLDESDEQKYKQDEQEQADDSSSSEGQPQLNSNVLTQIKKEQPEKWSQIVSLIKKNRHTDHFKDEQLGMQAQLSSSRDGGLKNEILYASGSHLSDRQKQSKQSQQVYHNNGSFRKRNNQDEPEEATGTEQHLNKKRPNKRQSFSSDSINQIDEEFNSRKYIQYLDSDMYPIAPHHSESLATIDKKKQQELLNKLQGQNSIRRLIKGNKILQSGDLQKQGELKSRLSCRSKSQLSYDSSIFAEQLKSSSRAGSSSSRRESKLLNFHIKKSTSEKNIKYSSIQSIVSNTITQDEEGPQDQNENGGIKIISNPITLRMKMFQKPREEIRSLLFDASQNKTQQMAEFNKKQKSNFDQKQIQTNQKEEQADLQKIHLEDELTKKLAELQNLRQEDSDQDIPKVQIDEHRVQDDDEIIPALHRSQNEISNAENNDDIYSEESDTAEKGEEVTEMLTNSLILEVLVQMAKCPQSILKNFKKLSFKKQKLKRAASKPKKSGFITSQAEIKTFIQDLCSYVLNQEPHIFKNLERATGPSALQMLKYMHQSVEDDIYLDQEQDDPSVMILPNWIFENFWSRKALTIQYERQGFEQQRQIQRQQYLKGLNKIFLRSCFDCLNECLDYERNYGPFGKPFPWKRSHFFDHIKSLEQTKKSVSNSQSKLFDISSSYCGIIIEKEQIATLCGNEDYIAQVQEDRLSRMLAKDLVEGEERWIFYDDEETELLVETSNLIFYHLIQEISGLFV